MDRKPKNIYVALMGLTGAGKSSFIDHCIKQQVVVGDGLQACTETVEVFSFEYSPGVTIHLVDTPGFDDTNRQDSAVLRDISAWLSKSYTEKILLNGILYLHRISDPRMQGSGKMSIHLLRKLCGKDAFKNVVLVTTMWELVEPEIGNRREKELEETEEFWGFMKRHGSQIRRHQNTEESAREILSMFVPETPEIQPEIVALAIQKELADEHKTLDQTSAGLLLDGTWAKEKEALKRELEEVREEVKIANEERDHMMAKLMQDQQKEMDINVEKIRMEQEKLRVTMEELHQERLSKYQKTLDEKMEVSRTLGKDLDEKTKLSEEEREKRQANTIQQKRKLQEQETAVSELQNRLSESNLSSSTPNTSETEHDSKNHQTYNITSVSETVTSLLFTSDGNTLFIGTEKRKIFVYSFGLRNIWRRYQVLYCGGRLSSYMFGRGDTVRNLIRSSDDSYLLAVCGDKMFRFEFDPSDSEFKFVCQEGWSGYEDVLALSSDNRYLVSARGLGHRFAILKPNFGYSFNAISFLNDYSTSTFDDMNATDVFSCIEFGTGGFFAIGLNRGYVSLFEIVDSQGSIKRRGGFETPGKVLSLAWLSDMRLLTGTEKGLYIGDADGTVDRIDKKRLESDRECWSHFIHDTMGVYGTTTGRARHYRVEKDRLIPMTTSDPVVAHFPKDAFTTSRREIGRLAIGSYIGVSIVTRPWTTMVPLN
ncbi:hypothetical protein FSHL1_009680 [Fusarium sambucinum]